MSDFIDLTVVLKIKHGVWADVFVNTPRVDLHLDDYHFDIEFEIMCSFPVFIKDELERIFFSGNFSDPENFEL